MLLDNSLDGVECPANHPGCGGVADILSVTMPLLSVKHLLRRMTHSYNCQDQSKLFGRRVELLIELFWR